MSKGPVGYQSEILMKIRKSAHRRNNIDMSQVVGSKDILFLCYDTLRYDVAMQEQQAGNTPNINRYGQWRKCHAAGSFTYPSHHAMFAGFLPFPWESESVFDARPLFFAKDIGMGRQVPPGAYLFEGANIIEGLAKDGYETICIGGVSFFNKRTQVNRVFPNMFRHSYWNPGFGCDAKDSTQRQIDLACQKLAEMPADKPVFLYINFSAIHYPNVHYLEGATGDSVASHGAALRYVDSCLPPLWKSILCRGGALVIATSDHGTCYGDDGKKYHGINHEVVNAVPYMEFMIE